MLWKEGRSTSRRPIPQYGILLKSYSSSKQCVDRGLILYACWLWPDGYFLKQSNCLVYFERLTTSTKNGVFLKNYPHVFVALRKSTSRETQETNWSKLNSIRFETIQTVSNERADDILQQCCPHWLQQPKRSQRQRSRRDEASCSSSSLHPRRIADAIISGFR